jgi:hypothetical protein
MRPAFPMVSSIKLTSLSSHASLAPPQKSRIHPNKKKRVVYNLFHPAKKIGGSGKFLREIVISLKAG